MLKVIASEKREESQRHLIIWDLPFIVGKADYDYFYMFCNCHDIYIMRFFIFEARRLMHMKNKKILWIISGVLLLICFILVCFFKPMTMNDIYSEPNFSGVVTDVSDKAIIVFVDEGEDELKSGDRMRVSLDVKLEDSRTHFDVGDKVKVFYDGVIAESYPAQINTVYAILLINE